MTLARFLVLTCLALPAAATAEEKPVALATKHIRATDGVDIVAHVGGKGETALLFLHGWCGDYEYWKHQLPEFADRYTVVTVDQAGHGASGKDRKNWTVESLGADVETIAKTLGLKRVIIVGHSMGAPVGLYAAKRMPGTVVAVIGVDTLQNAEANMSADQAKEIADTFEKNFQGTMNEKFTQMISAKSGAEVKQWVLSRAAAQDPRMAVGLMRDFGKIDMKVLLKEAKVPVRCINSAGGFAFFRPTAVDVNKKYADFKLVTIDEVGHYPMLEKPKEFNEKLREVLKEFAAK